MDGALQGALLDRRRSLGPVWAGTGSVFRGPSEVPLRDPGGGRGSRAPWGWRGGYQTAPGSEPTRVTKAREGERGRGPGVEGRGTRGVEGRGLGGWRVGAPGGGRRGGVLDKRDGQVVPHLK